jgi:hypothetical protein
MEREPKRRKSGEPIASTVRTLHGCLTPPDTTDWHPSPVVNYFEIPTPTGEVVNLSSLICIPCLLFDFCTCSTDTHFIVVCDRHPYHILVENLRIDRRNTDTA